MSNMNITGVMFQCCRQMHFMNINGLSVVCRNIGQKEVTIKEFVNGMILRSIFSFINNIVILFQI